MSRAFAATALFAALTACGGKRDTAAAGQSTATPTRTATPPVEGNSAGSVDAPCGGQGVVVTFAIASFEGVNAYDTAGTLRRLKELTQRVTAPIKELVTRSDYSPAIRTTRLALRDSAAVRRAVADLGKSADVSEVALDACALTIQRPK